MRHRATRHRTYLKTYLSVVAALAALAPGCATSAHAQPAASVLLEPISTTGANPFGPPVGTDQGSVTSPANSGGTFAGNAPGLFGGTEDQSSCDPQAMVAFLQAHPDKASAWAGVVGIAVADIPGFVRALTPVILRSDTAVTNHGFENGRATVIPAVLQAGTAVLVDKRGAPVTKCFCGNPLTAPIVAQRVDFVGTVWASFSASTITTIQPTTVVINQFTLVQPTTGASFDRPVGTQGMQDHPLTGPLPPTRNSPPLGQPSTTDPPPAAAPPTPAPPASPAPTRGGAQPGPHSASWAVGNCFAERRAGSTVLSGTVLVRNHDPAERHSYEVTVTFGSNGEGTTSINGLASGQTREATVTASGASATDGAVPCEITRIVDENGNPPTQGAALAPPPDVRPPPAASQPPTPEATPPPVTRPPVTRPPVTRPPETKPPATEPPATGTPTSTPSEIEPDVPLPTD